MVSTVISLSKPFVPTKMTIRAKKFTPEVLLSYPRRSAAIPNAAGTLALYTTLTYDFHTHSYTNEIRVLDILTGQSTIVCNDLHASEPKWLGNDGQIVWLLSSNKGMTKLVIGELGKPAKTAYVAAVFQGPVSNLKLKPISKHMIAIAVSGQSTPNGGLFNPETEAKPHSSARLYDRLFVRHWDRYLGRQKNSIWYGTLRVSSSSSDDSINRYVLSPPTLVNALKGSRLESPVPPYGGIDHYDISEQGLIFVAKDPALNPATTTKSDVYHIPLANFTDRQSSGPKMIKVDGVDGASASPVFSPDGRQIAFLKMTKIAYESDRNRLFIVPDVSDLSSYYELVISKFGTTDRILSPSALWWSDDAETMFFTAESGGSSFLFSVLVSPAEKEAEQLTCKNSISDVFSLGSGRDKLLVTSTNMVDNSRFDIIDLAKKGHVELVSSNTRNGSSLGLSPSQVSTIAWIGADRETINAWMVKPSNFSKNGQYPLAYLIHGGPQGAWGDSWSTRWNPAIFAEQGYIVICPNPTGSTGYGQEFTDRIQGQWGGRPYEDLVAGIEHIEKNLTFVDMSRAVALGASYGGYMVNWIQGQPLGRKFKALVTHDGVFSTLSQFTSEELYFPMHDFEGTLWTNREGFEKWDPASHVANWATPHLIIHNELDYRLPISEGLAAFNCLQVKGIPSRFLNFPDENHWVLKPENSLVWHQVVLEWINHHVGL
ncbi:MAG: hypothetical protein M1814_003361 [Vezdaea aestivalis]|nr:MAG: hypothetical protein M1814_003361 [Vezdaea aestivalis]